MIHPYLRAVGFSEYKTRAQINQLLAEVIAKPTSTNRITLPNGRQLGYFSKVFVKENTQHQAAGITVYGEYDEHGHFVFEYYYPFFEGSAYSTRAELSMEQATMQDYLEGMVDEENVGVSLIFFVDNMLECIEKKKDNKKQTSVSLKGFAQSGNILLPISKSNQERQEKKNNDLKRLDLIRAAKRGDESAIENLTLDEMDTYTTVSKKIKDSDIFSMVETYFMPNGLECDHYSVMAEIIGVHEVENSLTGEKMYHLDLKHNFLPFYVYINQRDLNGTPQVGRRFKANIWMTGTVIYEK